MYRYDIIYEALQEQIDDGEITLEFAEVVNDLAYERYVIEKKLTDEEKAERREGRKRKAKLAAKIATAIALGTAAIAFIKKFQSSKNSSSNKKSSSNNVLIHKDKLKHDRLTGEALKQCQDAIKECINELVMYNKKESPTREDYENAQQCVKRIYNTLEKIYKVSEEDIKNGTIPNADEFTRRLDMLHKKNMLYYKKFASPVYGKYLDSRFQRI